MASLQRLTKNRILGDIRLLTNESVENIKVYYFEHNMFEYFFLINGLSDDYEGGEYIGKITFDNEYPKTPPEFYMLTPSGRFEEGKKICLSNSKFHKNEWNPLWTIHAILRGFLSIFVEDKDSGISHMKTSKEIRKQLAKKSIKWNEEYGKRNNDIYNILKTQYIGHDRQNTEDEKNDTKSNTKDTENVPKSKKYEELEELAKVDKDFAKMFKDFKAIMKK
jgi:ubiquitin-protein ligase